MQQDVGDVDSTANAIRRIARSVIETGHNRIAAAAGRQSPRAGVGAASAVALPGCDRSCSAEVAN